jgi:hypothetical protein
MERGRPKTAPLGSRERTGALTSDGNLAGEVLGTAPYRVNAAMSYSLIRAEDGVRRGPGEWGRLREGTSAARTSSRGSAGIFRGEQ